MREEWLKENQHAEEKINETKLAEEHLAKEILKLARDTILIHLRFLDTALHSLVFTSYQGRISTDGEKLFYNPQYIIQNYKKEKNSAVRGYLHEMMHCIFRHMYLEHSVNQRYWSLACDIAVEYAINELHLSITETAQQEKQQVILQDLETKVPQLTAERLYRYFREIQLSNEVIEEWRQAFSIDEHSCWYALEYGETEENDDGGKGDSNEESDGNSESELGGMGNGAANEDADRESKESGSSGTDPDENNDTQKDTATGGIENTLTEEQWRRISETIQMELETFSKQKGMMAGALLQNIAEVNRKKYDYTKFLKKFAVRGEVLGVNDDEFDYIFYTYGLRLYKTMPLIEPLEYKEVKKIRDFVIAIDTSGSISLSLVRQFVQKTYDILKSEDSFFKKMNLHIIQCDAEIKEHIKITNQREFDVYLKNLQIHGRGGTDFRPVFTFVDELVKQKAFRDLKGLIYFTDGNGIFPQKKPNYDTAFVFVGDFYEQHRIPSWAIRLILEEDELNDV